MNPANHFEYLEIGWDAHPRIRALTTKRSYGVSTSRYRSFNLALNVGDSDDSVIQNRQALSSQLNLPANPKWLNQVHGNDIVIADELDGVVDADGSYTMQKYCVCSVFTADCLPVFLSDTYGKSVGVFHAGWRGLVNGILTCAVNALQTNSSHLIAAIGPSIEQSSFEVGSEVKEAFLNSQNNAEKYFISAERRGHYYADLYGLAKSQLLELGVKSVWLPQGVCTYKNVDDYYSYRRDGQTGRMASLIWISE